jgi:hypothetical protein
MENAQLAFVSPTLLDDDARWAIVAHELAHAWSGNLVGAASLEHFWLNEAFAVWGERRMLAALVGRDAAEASQRGGRRQLAAALRAFAALPERTRLHTTLAGVDPDEALSIVPYEKGYLCLRAIEDAVGEARFAAFVRDWLARARTVTSDDFARAAPIDVARWLDEPGLPIALADAPAEIAPLPADWAERLKFGRLAWIRPIYAALCRERRDEVAAVYRAHRASYHPVARQQLERLLREQGIAVDTANPLGLRRRP